MNFLDQLRARLNDIVAERNAAKAELDSVLSVPTAENRDLNSDEAAAFEAAKAKVTDADARYDATKARITELEAIEDRQNAEAAARPTLPAGESVVRSEERTYRPDREVSFICDLFASQMRTGDHRGADERLERHRVETEARAITSSAVGGLIPPQYLLDQFAPVARAGRPFLNSLNALPLPPDGLTFVVPRGTTGATAAMTSEGAAFNDTTYAETDLSASVKLVTGAIDISRTMFMRGGSLVDQVLFPDIIAASEVALNASAIAGNGSGANHLGILSVAGVNAVTYTDASPTVGEVWPKVSDAVQRINSIRYMPATTVWMHPRRWGWITSALDSTGRPLFNFTIGGGGGNLPAIAVGEAATYGQVVGTLQGLPVISDATIPTNLGAGTNEDTIIIARNPDLLYWEDSLMQFTFEQQPSTAPGQVRLAAGRFSLFIPGRYPGSISTIGGTGLVTPAF